MNNPDIIEELKKSKNFMTTRKELADKYFDGMDVYEEGNMGIVSLLSDVQHMISDKHYIEILNDIKSILITDAKKVK